MTIVLKTDREILHGLMTGLCQDVQIKSPNTLGFIKGKVITVEFIENLLKEFTRKVDREKKRAEMPVTINKTDNGFQIGFIKNQNTIDFETEQEAINFCIRCDFKIEKIENDPA